MNTRAMMLTTLAALMPGFGIYAWVFGPGVILNVVAAILIAMAAEAGVLRLRGQSLNHLRDSSAILTGLLLGLCLPPLLPLWMLAIGVVFAVLFGKQVYGGTGRNIFNPAMVGFAVMIVAFPLAMSHWPATDTGSMAQARLETKFSASSHDNYDGMTGATPLDAYKFREGKTNDEFFTAQQVNNWQSWVSINLAFLAGGFYLLYRRVIRWQAPLGFLLTIGLLSLVFYDAGSSAGLGSPVFHLFSGATMLAAFFILTDPVTSPGHPGGLLIFAVGVGLITFIIRTMGAYPEGVAFAVLLMNAASPLVDHLCTPRERVS